MKAALGALRQRLEGASDADGERWSVMAFWIGLAFAFVSALPVFFVIQSVIENNERNHFVAAAEKAAYRLAHQVDLTFANLRAVKGLYKGSVHVSREEFSAFVQALQPSTAVKSLQWIPRVSAGDRAEFELTARENGFAGFDFHEYDAEGRRVPVTRRSDYFPIYYMEPHVGDEATLGLDLGADPVSLDALRRARDSGAQTVSGRVRLGRDHIDQYGFSVFEPIYAETALNLDTRIDRLEGFAHGIFRIVDLVQLAIPRDQFHVAVFDRSAASDAQQLYPPAGMPLEAVEPGRGFVHEVTLQIADRSWSVMLAPTGGGAASTLPWLAALLWLGLLMALWFLRELVSSRRHSRQLSAINYQLEALSNQRKQAIKELERSNRELDDFAYIASHDLKEPLRAVFNHATFLLEDYEERLDEDGRKRLHRLIMLSRRMQKLIGDLLYFSRLGRGDLAKEAVDLDDVIADVEASLAESLQRRNVKLVVAAPLPAVRGHRPHMTALFQNLICNAMKYNDSEEKSIEIGCMPAQQSGEVMAYDRFYVRDNGIGIDEPFKDDVFRIFKRLNSDQAYGEGTGAGLSFVKKIVESHGGTIWLTSTLGEGTTFFFTLEGASQERPEGTLLQAA